MTVQPAKTAFTLYTSDCHARLKSEASTKPMGERMKAIAEGWRTLAESERQKYESLAGRDRERFARESRERDAQVLREQAAKRADAEELGDRRRKRTVLRETDDDENDDDSEYDEERPKKVKKKKVRVMSKERREELAAKREARERREETVAEEAEALDKRAASSASARLQYLLSQSDIFSHFGCAKDAGAAAAPKKKGGLAPRSPAKRRDDAAKNEDEDVGDGVDGPPIILSQPPSVTGGKLRPYQIEGLNWMIRLDHYGVNGILADEMGLGKTLQCISMLSWLADAKNIKGPHLVLAPKSTLGNWMGEFARWCPNGLRAVRFHGTKAERKDFVEDVLKPGEPSHLRDWDVVIATYEVANAERTSLEKISWRFVVIDEAHRIKNEASVFARTARALRSDRRLLITGTPLQNNLHELWALLNFLLPDVFASSEQFDEWFNLDVDDTDAKKRMISQLHKLLRPFVLRRLKADVEKSLPAKTETILFTGLSVKQKEVYKGLLKRDASLLLSGGGDTSEGTTASRTAISNIAMQLRKCCNHPYLFRGVEDRSLPPLGEHVVENCGKLKLLDKLLVKLFSRGHRVLVFSQMTQLLDILEDMMHMRGYQYCRIDGNTSYDDRDELIQAYNAPDSSKFVFLLSTRAGGLGINLQTADTCVLYDSDWNPQADLQAMDRCHRIGQKKPVHVYRLVTANTIEEKVVERATKKLKLDAMVVQQGRLSSGGTQKQGPSKDEMLEAVKFGASHIFRSDENEVTDEDIDQILDRGREKTKAFMDKIQQKTEDEEDLLDFRLDGGGTTQEFEGVDYSKKENRASALAAKAAADHEVLTQLVIADFDKSTRDRPRTAATYNLNLLSNGGVDRSARRNNPVPPARRIPKMEDWQFFEKARLTEIAKTEEDAYAALDAAGSDDPAALEAAKENGVLSPELEEEKAKLLAAGFSTWTKTRFRDWTRMVGRHGRDNHAAIAQSLVDLGYPVDEAEVTRYSDVFWAKGAEALPEAEYERALRTIKKGEKAIEQNAAVQQSLRRYIEVSGGPKRVLERGIVDISAGAQNADDFERPFSRAEDRWLLTEADATGEAGEPDGDDLFAAVSVSTGRFIFDHFMLSREPRDLAARAALLAKKTEDFAAVEEKEIKAREMSGGKTAEQITRELDENDKAWAQSAAEDALADARVNEIKNLLRSKQNEHRVVLSKLPANMRTSTPSSNSRNSIMRPPSTAFVAYVADKAMGFASAENENRALVDRDIGAVATLILERLEKAWHQEPEDVKQSYAEKCRPLPSSHSSRRSTATPTDGPGADDDDDDDEVDARNSTQKPTPNIIIKIPKKRDSAQASHPAQDNDDDSPRPSVPKKRHDDHRQSIPKKRHDNDSTGGGRPSIPKKRTSSSLEIPPAVDEYSSQPSSSPRIPKKVKRVSS